MTVRIDLATVGHILNEVVKYPEKTIGPVLGGPAAYTAVASARLKVKTGIVTKIGEDVPRTLLEPFYEAGVDVRGLKIEGENTTTNYLIYDNRGDKTLVYLKKAPRIRFEDVPEDYLKSKFIHVCPLDFEVPIETLMSLKEAGLRLSVDLGGYGGATSIRHPSRDEEAKKFFEEAIKYFEIVRASLEDCRHIFGDRRDLPKHAVRFFVDKGADIGLVTLGEEGAILLTRKGDFYKIPGFKSKIVDVTGAGDVFCAGFLSEYLRTEDPLKSVIFGCAAASLLTEKTGGVLASRMPTLDEVRRRISATSKLKELFTSLHNL